MWNTLKEYHKNPRSALKLNVPTKGRETSRSRRRKENQEELIMIKAHHQERKKR